MSRARSLFILEFILGSRSRQSLVPIPDQRYLLPHTSSFAGGAALKSISISASGEGEPLARFRFRVVIPRMSGLYLLFGRVCQAYRMFSFTTVRVF